MSSKMAKIVLAIRKVKVNKKVMKPLPTLVPPLQRKISLLIRLPSQTLKTKTILKKTEQMPLKLRSKIELRKRLKRRLLPKPRKKLSKELLGKRLLPKTKQSKRKLLRRTRPRKKLRKKRKKLS